MDPPDSTESILSLSFDSEIFGHEPNIQSEAHDDFLDDFFSGVQNENKESIVVADQLEVNSECDKKMESNQESPDPIPSVNEAMTEKLKQQIKELKEKMLKQEHELAKYEVELSEKMSCLLQVQMERDSLKENLGISDSQRSSLQSKLEEKEAELKQFKELVQKQVSEEEDIHHLKKQMSIDAKLLKKTERDLQRNTELLNKARENVRHLKRRNKKLISTLLEFGALLQQKELLSSKKKKFLEVVKKWVGELSDSSMELVDTSSLSDEENEENNNFVDKIDIDLNTVNSSCKVNINIKEEVNSPPSNDACLTPTTESFSNGFVDSIKSSPFFLVEDGFVGRTKIHKYAPSPLAVGNKVISHLHVTCKTEEVAPDKANRLSPDSNFLPFTSGTESQCSEDIEMTDDYFAEIKKGIKGWVLKSENFAPLSPLPPSPKESITVTHKKLFNKSEKYENSKKCPPVSSLSDTSPELIPQEDIQVFQNSPNLKSETQISKNSDQSNSLCNVSSIKSKASTTSPEPNSETLSCKNEFSQSSLLKETEDTGVLSNNCLSTLSNIEQEISPQSPEPPPKPVENKVFFPAHSSTLNEVEKMESISSPLSPVLSVHKSISPSSPKLSPEILNDISQPNSATSACRKIDSHSLISYPEKTICNKTCSPEQPPVCFKTKNIFSHQNSKGFEPHINELNEKGNSVPNKSYETSVLSSEIPPELHYLSSTYSESNKVKILHQGNSVYDYLINPDTKLSVCVLTVPSKSTSSNQLDCRTLNACADSEKLLSNQEERKRRVLSVYRATERRLNLINRQIIKANSPRENSNNSLNENSSHIYVVVENKNNDSLNCFGDNTTLQNVNDSGMDLECTASEDILMKDNSSESNKDLGEENQSFVSSSCDISTPSKKKLLSSSFKYHSGSQNNSSENLSSAQMENLTNLSVSEFTAKKKRLSHIDEKLPSKKQRTEAQLSTEPESFKLNVINSKKSVDFCTKTPKHSPLKSQVQLQNSVTTSSLLSDNNKHEKITSELQCKSQISTTFSVTQLTPKKPPLNISLLTDVDNLNLLQKDSSKTSLLNYNNSLGEKKNSSELSQLPFLTEDNLQIKLKNSLPENPSLSDSTLKTSPSELKNSANDQPGINNPLLEIKDSPSEQSVSELNDTLEHKNSPHHHLTEHNSPSKEIPSCILNEAQLSKSSSINQTAFDCQITNTPEKSVSNSQSVSNIASPKVKHKKSLPKNKSKTNAKNSKHNKLSDTSKRSVSKSQSVSNIVSPKVKKSLPKNKSKTNAKNSKHNKLSEFVPKARDSPELKILSSCEPQSTTPSELKGSTNDQPLSDNNNPLLENKNSPSEQSVIKINTPSDKSISTFCNPELLSKNVESNQFISKEHSFPLDNLNSPSKSQTHSPINSNTSTKDPLESCTEYQMLDQSNLPSEIQIKSEINNVQFELKDISSPTNSYVPSVCSPLLYLEDNTLVIDEQISVEEEIIENDSKEDIIANIKMESQEVSMINGSDSECLEKTTEVDKVVKNSKKKDKTPKSKKKKNKTLLAKKKNLNPSKEEQSLCPLLSIHRVLEQIDEVKIFDSLNESHFKLHAHTLFSALINPSNASSTASVLFQIFNHLISSRTNPLMSFPFKYDSSVFFPLTERCIVLALMQAERKRKNHLKGLKDAAISNLFLLILSKSSISKTGLGAFCRVFTELCKHSEERRKPVMLCCELIKANHKFAPILIASVMGVWPELFSYGGQVPEEEIILHASLAFGLQKKPSSLTSADWKQCKAVFSKYLLSSPVIDVEETTKNLTEILEDYLEETPIEKDYLLTDPLLIFAACKGWNWADENLSSFILSSLAKYAQQKDSERAFSLFCNLYADMSLLCPDFESSSEILEQLFTLEGAFEYVKGYAARSMIKLYLLSKHKFPPYLVEWTQENESKLIGTPTELLLKQCCLSDVSSFSENDIIAL